MNTELFDVGTCNWCQKPGARLSTRHVLNLGKWFRFCDRCEKIIDRQIQLGQETKQRRLEARRNGYETKRGWKAYC
jgi:hypothetical protein